MKAKTSRRISFSQFLDALSALATVKYYGVVEDAATAFSLLLTNQVFQTPPSLGIVSAVADGQLRLGRGIGGVKLGASGGGGGGGRPVSSPARSSSPRRGERGERGEWDGAAASATTTSGAGAGASPRSPSGIAAAMLRSAGYWEGVDGGAQQQQQQSLHRSMSAFPGGANNGGSSSGGAGSNLFGGVNGSTNDMASPVLSFVTPPVDVYELVLRKAYEATMLGHTAAAAASSSSSSGGGGGGAFTPGAASTRRSVAVGGGPSLSSSSRGGGGGASGAARPGPGRSGPPTSLYPPVSLAPSEMLAATMGQSPRPHSPRAAVERGPGMARYGEADFAPTIAGSANRPGSVYERLADPSSFTGVYRRAWQSDGRINHFTETGLSLLPSRFRGNTNTGSDETIRDIRVLLRPNLNVGRYFK